MVKENGNTKGFTLIELLVVVLIIGILAAVAMPQYQYAVARAKYKQVVVLGRAFQKAQKMYYLANGEYALNFDGLSLDFPPPNRTETGSNGTIVLRYNWGSCSFRKQHLGGGRYEYDMQCYPTNAPTLEIELDDQNTMSCVANINNSRLNKICRLETGKETPDRVASEQYNYYNY